MNFMYDKVGYIEVRYWNGIMLRQCVWGMGIKIGSNGIGE